MFKLILNNTIELDINSFGRTTNFNSDNMYSQGYIVTNSNASSLYSLAGEKITSLAIKKDDEIIYNLIDIDAKINSIDETLGLEQMTTNINIIFNI